MKAGNPETALTFEFPDKWNEDYISQWITLQKNKNWETFSKFYEDKTDFEDAVQSVASEFNKIDYIITRNTKDFENSEIEAITPKDFLKILENVKN